LWLVIKPIPTLPPCLGMAEMAKPWTRTLRKFAKQWFAKMALYPGMGVTPVMIEPNARISWPRAEIATQLAIPLPVTSGKVVRAKGY
jgi:hypothetical protein